MRLPVREELPSPPMRPNGQTNPPRWWSINKNFEVDNGMENNGTKVVGIFQVLTPPTKIREKTMRRESKPKGVGIKRGNKVVKWWHPGSPIMKDETEMG
jgi:hypothetical protein